jgi:hypothetical protein
MEVWVVPMQTGPLCRTNLKEEQVAMAVGWHPDSVAVGGNGGFPAGLVTAERMGA